jgi:hypothetical protein
MAIALVTGANTADTDTAASVTTDAIDTTGANLIVLARSRFNSPAISDSKTNTWTGLTERTVSGHPELQIYYTVGSISVGSGHTFTAAAANCFSGLAVAAFSGVDIYNSQESGAGFTATTSSQPGSLTPSTDGCLLVCALSYDGTQTLSLATAGWTILNQMPLDSGNAYGIALAYKIQGTAAAENPQWTWTGNQTGHTAMAVFAPAAGAATKRRYTLMTLGVG